jgi:hypothetical protein
VISAAVVSHPIEHVSPAVNVSVAFAAAQDGVNVSRPENVRGARLCSLAEFKVRVRPFRRWSSNSLFERSRQVDGPLLRDAANDEMVASAAGPPGERKIAPALRAHRGVQCMIGNDAKQDRRA